VSRRGGGSRSEEERLRARLEREQRRARREGRPVPQSIEELDGVVARRQIADPDVAVRPPTLDPPPIAAEPPPAGAPRTAATPPPAEPPTTAPPAGRSTAAAPADVTDRQPAPPHRLAPRTGPPPPAASRARGSDGGPAAAPSGGPPASSAARPAPEPPPVPTAASRPRRGPAAEQPSTAAPPSADERQEVAPRPSRDERRAARREARSAKAEERVAAREAKRRAKVQRRTGTAPVLPGAPPAATVLAPRTAPARRGVSRIAAALVLLPFVLALVIGVILFQPFKGEGGERVVVRIPPGSSVDDIGRLLEQRGVVSNATFFAVRARLSGAAGDLRAGRLELREGMSYGAAIEALQQDPLPPATVTVTIPEGLSRREAAVVARKAGIRGSYMTASARSAGFDPHRYGQPRSRSGLEGFLFPATYELQRGGATAEALVAQQVASFRRQIKGIDWRRARRAKLDRYDVLTIASLIEREVRVPSERRLVAAVIYNRLAQGTPLYIDATIRYAERNWSRPLRQSELDRPGPYNTRLRKGLPPTPIGSPGRAAIEAAASPARSKAIYYVVRPCGKGRHNFSTTAAQFNRDSAYYESERKRVGGDPSNATGCRKR